MKIAVVGSRNITLVDIGRHISDAEEIVSGGAKGGLLRGRICERKRDKAHRVSASI